MYLKYGGARFSDPVDICSGTIANVCSPKVHTFYILVVEFLMSPWSQSTVLLCTSCCAQMYKVFIEILWFAIWLKQFRFEDLASITRA